MVTPSGFRGGARRGLRPLIARVAHRRAASITSDSGYTLIELLIVIAVLGILASVVVFGLSGVSSQSDRAACASDAKTVAVAIGAFEVEHPSVAQVTEAQLIAAGTGSLQSWPVSPQGAFAIEIAGDGNLYVHTTDAFGNLISANDVLVVVGASVYDATASLPQSCSTVA